MTTTHAMKINKATANTFKEIKNTQNRLINSEMLNNNKFLTDLELISCHINSAAGEVVCFKIIFALFLCWCVSKKKNMKKICTFLCVKKCRVTEEIFYEPEPSMSYTTRNGP